MLLRGKNDRGGDDFQAEFYLVPRWLTGFDNSIHGRSRSHTISCFDPHCSTQSLAGERYPLRVHGAREPLETVCGQPSVELARDHTAMSQRLERDLKVHLVLQMEALVL